MRLSTTAAAIAALATGPAVAQHGAARLFSVPAGEGNYRVTVTLGDAKRASTTTIKAESRRLMVDAVALPAGTFAERGFVVNVRNARLGDGAVRLKSREEGSFTWDDRLTLEILGDTAAIAGMTIEPVTVPTLFLLGDSTVTDQRFEPAASWGQMLPAFLISGVAVANHAESGETLAAFRAENRLAKVLALARPGDVAMIQFGHNDQKRQWAATYADPATTYRDRLRDYIRDLRARGVTPILVTPPERRTFGPDGRIRPTLADQAAAMRAVGAAETVPVIDLGAASVAFYEALGPVRATLAFNDGGRDATHHDNYGAWVLARSVADGMRRIGGPAAGLVAPGLPAFDPAHPPAPETFRLAASAASSAVRPEGS